MSIDARLPSHWLTDPDMDLLTDRAWRTFTGALMWSNGAGTDGRIPVNALRFLHPLGTDSTTAAELVKAGRWAPTEDGGYQVSDWTPSQSLAEDVARNREQARLRQQRHRERLSGVMRDSTENVTRDVTSDVTRESPGQERTGKDSVRELKLSVTSAGDSQLERVATQDDTLAAEAGCSNCIRLGENGPCNTHYQRRKSA